MTQRKQETIRAEKRRLQKARVEWKKANPEAAAEKHLANLLDRESRALVRNERLLSHADRQHRKHVRYQANKSKDNHALAVIDAKRKVGQIIRENRVRPKTDPKRMTFLAKLRQLTRTRMLRTKKVGA